MLSRERLVGAGHDLHQLLNQIPARILAVVDVASRRRNPNDPGEQVFTAAYQTTARAIERAVEAAATLEASGKDASRLRGFTWHGNRHTLASRLVMAGVDLRRVQELGGWRTLSMVQRYAHLAPERLVAAVERLVGAPAPVVPAAVGERAPGAELRQNFGEGENRSSDERVRVS